jgi:hypothetical protein
MLSLSINQQCQVADLTPQMLDLIDPLVKQLLGVARDARVIRRIVLDNLGADAPNPTHLSVRIQEVCCGMESRLYVH